MIIRSPFSLPLGSVYYSSELHRHRAIPINQPTRYNTFTNLLLDVHMWLTMFRASPRSSSGAYNCTRSLWFYLWKETAGELLVVVWQCRADRE